MANREVRFDFFTVQVEDITPDELAKLMDAAFTQKEARVTKVTHNSAYYRLESFVVRPEPHLQQPLRLGTVIKMVDTALPQKANLQVPGIKSLGLADEEALAGETAFLFSPDHMVLILQRNQMGVSPRPLIKLFEKLLGVKGLDLLRIPDRQVLAKYKKMKIFRTLLIKGALPTDAGYYEDESLKAVAGVAGGLGANYVSVQVSIGHAKGSLAENRVKKLVRNLLKLKQDGIDVRKVELSGKDFDDGVTEAVDLLTEHLIAVSDVPLKGRVFQTKDLLDAVHRVFDEHEDDLEEFRPVA